MGLFSRRRRATTTVTASESRSRTTAHFAEFVRTRVGVEGYVEPATANDPTTMVLVARDGEWTRRRVPDRRAAWELGRTLGIPVYDVHLTGYPAAMRRWSTERRRSWKHVTG